VADLTITLVDAGLTAASQAWLISTCDVYGRPRSAHTATQQVVAPLSGQTTAGTATASLTPTANWVEDDVYYKFETAGYSRIFSKGSGTENLVATTQPTPVADAPAALRTTDLVDWSSATPTVGDVPIWDGTDWEPGAQSAGGVMSAADILTAIKTVDGAGSGLDADLLDGQSAAAFEAAGTAAALVDDLSGVTNAATARSNLGLGTLSEVTQAGRATLTATPASGVARRLLQMPFDKAWRLFLPLTGATVTSLGSGAAAASTGTITTVAVANVAQALINIASAASAGADAEIRQTIQPWYRGASSDTYGGVFWHARVRFPDASYNETGALTGSRINAGLTSVAPITTRRAGSIHFAGFNREHENGHNTDTNWQFITNDGGVTATTTDTGIAFAVSTVYDLWLWMPAGATTAYWQIDDVTNSTTASGSHTTDLPGATTALYPWTGLRTNDAVARTIQIARVYVEADKG